MFGGMSGFTPQSLTVPTSQDDDGTSDGKAIRHPIPQKGASGKSSIRGSSYSGHRYMAASSSLQKSIRRGRAEEGVYWALEMSLGDVKACITNTWNRLQIISVEDVGQADPLAPLFVLMMRSAFGSYPAKQYICMAAEYLARAPKSRINDWCIYTYGKDFNDGKTSLQYPLLNNGEVAARSYLESAGGMIPDSLAECLKVAQGEMKADEREKLIAHCMTMVTACNRWKLRKGGKVTKAPRGKGKSMSFQTSLTKDYEAPDVMSILTLCSKGTPYEAYVGAIKQASDGMGSRKSDEILFIMQILYMWTAHLEPPTPQKLSEFHTYVSQQDPARWTKYIEEVRSGSKSYGVPDYAHDSHAGSKTRDHNHFVNVGSVILNVPVHLAAIDLAKREEFAKIMSLKFDKDTYLEIVKRAEEAAKKD